MTPETDTVVAETHLHSAARMRLSAGVPDRDAESQSERFVAEPARPLHRAAVTTELSFSELRYRRLFEAAHDGILILDPQTRRIVDVNPFLVSFLGYTHAEFLGKELFEIGLLKDEPANQAAFRELQSVGSIRYDDLPLETKDGRRVDVEFVSNIYREGGRQIIQCNIRDITVRKRSDLALRESERRFQLVARAVSDVAWDWDLVTGSRWWSDGLTTAFGYTDAELGTSLEAWTQHIHHEDRRRVLDSLYEAIGNGAGTWTDEYRFLRKNNSIAVVLDRGCILRDSAGKATRVVGGMQDLTDSRKLETQYLRTQRVESIGTLAGGIAHDLNNVLTPIMMSITLLQHDSASDPDHDALLDSIRISCQRGAALVRQVLSFARGLGGLRTAVSPRHLIDELKGLLAGTLPSNITIVVQVPDGVWDVVGDPTQLEQVLLNLAVNARDAMPQGGTLTLSAINTVLGSRHASPSRTTGSGRRVLFQVADTGHGIPEQIRERIFDPFFTTKEPGHGTGLGLATAQTIVNSHGGSMTVESEPGLGTTFSIYLPAAAPGRATDSSVPSSEAVPRGHDELVLVVEDETAIRNVTRRLLEAHGYQVLTAANGAEAIALYTQQVSQIAVVLTDMMMPVMDGAATIRALQSLNPAVRIIAVSGLDLTESAGDGHPLGAHDFLAKPYTAHTLGLLLREVLDRPAATAAA
jgi:PAS domain S-box-containing protein